MCKVNDRAGKCAGNAETATDLAEASDPAGTFQFACEEGFALKLNPETIDLGGGDKTTCCDAVFTCPTGESVKLAGEVTENCCHTCTVAPTDCATLIPMVIGNGCYAKCTWTTAQRDFDFDKYSCTDAQKKDYADAIAAAAVVAAADKEKCEDAQAITHKDYQGDSDAGTHVAQCFDINTNSETDVTKWTFEKGTGSCAVCKDAVQLRFGSTCEGAPGKDCKHCQGSIDAYKDCPTTAAKDSKTDIDSKTVSNTVTPTFSVAHTITLEGISAAEFMADPKIIASFQSTVATTLDVATDKIINIKAKSSRRQLSGRGMAAAGCRYV